MEPEPEKEEAKFRVSEDLAEDEPSREKSVEGDDSHPEKLQSSHLAAAEPKEDDVPAKSNSSRAENVPPAEEKKIEPKPESEREAKIDQEQYTALIKECLTANKQELARLLEGKVMIGQSEEGGEHEIVMINDLVEILTPVCKSRLSSQQLAELGNFFRSLVDNNEDFIFFDELLAMFGEKSQALPEAGAGSAEEGKEQEDIGESPESEEGLMDGMDKLDDTSLGIIAQLIQYLQENNVNFFDLFKSAIYQQQIVVEEQEEMLDVIEAANFYAVLKEAGIVQQEHKNLSEFLCIDTEYLNILMVKKILKLVEHVAMGLEQQHAEEGTKRALIEGVGEDDAEEAQEERNVD